MSIVIKNLKKAYDNNIILDDVNMTLNLREHIALIGENGVGKTTLLNILAGVDEPTSGRVTKDEYSQTVIVTQDFPSEFILNKWKVRKYIEYLGGEKLLRSTLRIMKDFNLGEEVLDLEISHLSGGQKKIIDISTSFARKPQYLFLDEPENHIDIFGRQVLIEMIKNFRGCLVFVSHDQDLINSVTNRILEIEEGKIISYTGTYEFYLEEKQRQEEARKKDWKHHENEVKRLDALVKRIREWVKKNPDLGKMLRAKKTQLEKLKDNAPKKPKREKKMSLSLNDVDQKKSKIILRVENFSLKLGERSLFYETDAHLVFGEKVALVGKNGTGKTTLLRVIMGQISSYKGSVRLGVNVNVGYFSQDHLDAIDQQKTPLEVLGDIVTAPEHKLRSTLAKFLIGENSYNRPIRTLSGGQKTRLRFCLLFSKQNELLLLDEPTNHLDNTSWNILIQAVEDFNGTILMVSHDRVFIDQTATKLWTIEDRHINEYLGTLTDYLVEE